jgi:hypothetical protein
MSNEYEVKQSIGGRSNFLHRLSKGHSMEKDSEKYQVSLLSYDFPPHPPPHPTPRASEHI